ncbi:hypothetical protein Tco_1367676 [Tanacetum coccineum]
MKIENLCQISTSEKLTCRRTRQVWSHLKNSGEADMSKDRSGLESLVLRQSNDIERQTEKGHERVSSGETKLTEIFINIEAILPSSGSLRKFTSTFGVIRGTGIPIYLSSKRREKNIVGSQLVGEEDRGTEMRGMGTNPRKG